MPCSLTESLNIVEISVSSQLIYRFYLITVNPSKILGEILQNCFQNLQGNAKVKKSQGKSWGHAMSELTKSTIIIYYKTRVMDAMW